MAGPPLVKIAPPTPAGNDDQLVSGGTTARSACPSAISQLRPSLARLIVTPSNATGWFPETTGMPDDFACCTRARRVALQGSGSAMTIDPIWKWTNPAAAAARFTRRPPVISQMSIVLAVGGNA